MNGVRPTSASGALGLPGVGLLSRSPFLPIPPLSLPPPLAALPSISRWRWAVGGWWGWEGGARLGSAGDRPLASCHRLWDGWKGQQGRWLWGLLRHGGGSIPAKCYSSPPRVLHHPPPAAALAESESRAKGARPVAVLSPLPTLPTAGHAGVCWGSPLQGRDRFPTPARPQPGGSGRGGLSPVRPGQVVPSSRRVVFLSRRSVK